MNIFIKYLYWQFILTPKKVLEITKNYLVFGTIFFSIGETLRSLFSPWRRYVWDYGRGFDFARYFEVFFSNVITRVIGFIMRLFLIILFIVYEVFFLAIGLICLILSIIYPFIAIYGILYSFNYL